MKPDADKTNSVLARIRNLEAAIAKGREYLQSGEHADWRGFRALFNTKTRAGKELPPHPDWVRNWFLPNRERALRRAEKLLERMTAGQEDS